MRGRPEGLRAWGTGTLVASGASFDDVAVRCGRQPRANAGKAVEGDPVVVVPVPAEDELVRVLLDGKRQKHGVAYSSCLRLLLRKSIFRFIHLDWRGLHDR